MNNGRTVLPFLALVAVTRFLTLGAYPLIDPTEGRYAEIAREMVATNDWVVPMLAGAPFWGKPPLSFWATAASYQAFGMTEFASRFPSFVMAVVTCVLTYLLATHLRDKAFGVFTTSILASTGLFYVLAGGVMTDPALGVCTTLSMVAFVFALQAPSGTSRLVWGYVFFLGLAGSLLAKGLVGLALIMAPIFGWAVLTRRVTEVRRGLPWKPGLVLTLTISIPWHILMEIRTPGFLEYYVVGEHFKRFMVSGWEGNLYGNSHRHTPGTIWGFFVVATVPWVFMLAPALLWVLKRRAALVFNPSSSHVYLALWCLAPAVFFTFSQNIMITYLLPSLPAFAILTAVLLSEVASRSASDERPWFVSRTAARCGLLTVPVAFTLAATAILPTIGSSRSQRELVTAFRAAQDEHAADLLYIGRLPYSAEFYSNGQAERFVDSSIAAFRDEFADDEDDYFAIEKRRLLELPEETLSSTMQIGEFGKYVLRREVHRCCERREAT